MNFLVLSFQLEVNDDILKSPTTKAAERILAAYNQIQYFEWYSYIEASSAVPTVVLRTKIPVDMSAIDLYKLVHLNYDWYPVNLNINKPEDVAPFLTD